MELELELDNQSTSEIMGSSDNNHHVIINDLKNNSSNGVANSSSSSSTANANMAASSGIFKSNFDTDLIRIIGQHLVGMGLKQTVNLLLEESGLKGLDHPTASQLQQHIIAGQWDEANCLAQELSTYSQGDQKANLNEMKLWIAEQKFLELVEDNQRIKALQCLRNEITPLMMNNAKRIQHLAILLMCRSQDDLRSKAQWPGKGLKSRQALVEKFENFIPPMMMLPPRRLNTLLKQAVQLQREKCPLHLIPDQPDLYQVDLKHDHQCSTENFPLHTRQELKNHQTEVWYCKFSNDGKKLATGGLEGKIIIWDIDPQAKQLNERCILTCNCQAITCLSWSPNDAYLLACGSEERPDLWIWDVNKEKVHNMINHTNEECTTTCSWHLSGEKFAAASIKGNFNIYNLDGQTEGTREGVRVQCLSFLHKDPSIILAADNLNRIKSYAIRKMSLDTEEDDVLEERHPIMSFSLDKDDKYIAVNLMDQGIHLWDYKSRTMLRVFSGIIQRNFTIYSTFSSPDPTFLASGSEDGKIFIYNIHKDQPAAILHGHSRCVSCVCWNPIYPELLVSVSDDRTVRLWGPTPVSNIPASTSTMAASLSSASSSSATIGATKQKPT